METPLDLDDPGGSLRGDVTPSLHSLPADGSTASGGVHTNSAGVSNVTVHGNDRSNEHVTNDPFSQVPASPTNVERIPMDAKPSSDVHAYVDNSPSSLENQYQNQEDINLPLDSFRLHDVADENTLSEMSDENRGDFDGLWDYVNPVLSPFGNVIGSISALGFDSSISTPFLEEHVGDTNGQSLHESMLYFDPALHDNAVFDTHDNPGRHPVLNDFIESDWPDGGGDVMIEHGRDSDGHGQGDDVMPDGSDAVKGVKSNGEAELKGMHGELGMASDGAQSQGDVNVGPGENANGRDISENIDIADGKNLASEQDDIVDGEEDDDEGEDLDEDEDEEEEEEYEEGGDDEGDEDDDELLDESVDIPGGEAAGRDGKVGENDQQKNMNVTDDVKTESLDGEAKDSVEENNDSVKDDTETVSAEKTGDNAGMPGYVKESTVEQNSVPATATGEDIHGSTTVGLDDVTTIHGLDSSQTIIAEGTTIVEDYIQQASKVVILESSQITLPTRSIEATPTPEPAKSSVSVDAARTLSPPVEPTPVIVPPSVSTAVTQEPMKNEDSEGRKAETTDVVEQEDDDDDELIDIQAEFKEVTGLPMKPPSIPGGMKSDAYVTPGFQTRRPLANPDDATPPTVKETHETTSEKNTPDGVTPVPIDIEVAPPVGDVGATTEPDIQVAEEGDVDATTQEGGSGWIIVSFAVNVLTFLEPILQALVNVVSTFIRCSFTTHECHIFKSTTHTIPSF